MIVVPFDTLKLAKRLQDAGFPKKQASGAAEGLAEVLGESYPTKDAVIDSVEALGRGVDRRFTEQSAQIGELKADVTELRADVAELKTVQAQHGQALDSIQTMLGKILEGQAVLLQNDMELNRKLKDR